MKQSLLNFSLLLLLLVGGSGIDAKAFEASGDPIFKVSTKDEFDLCTLTNPQYDRASAWEWYNYSGGYMRLWYYNSSSYGPYLKDYATTPALQLAPGKLYAVTFTPLAYNSGKTGSLKVLLGTGDDPEQYQVLADITDCAYGANVTTGTERVIEFAVPDAGEYHISLLGYSQFLKVYDFKIWAMGESTVPEAPSALTVTPDAEGAATAEISFTMPTATLTGQDLDGTLTYTVKRGDTTIAEGSAAPGATVSLTDAEAPEGEVSYKVTVASGEDVSEAVVANTFIGLETPAAVSGLAFTSAGDSHTITWAAPTGIHGIAIDPSKLTYTVCRIVAGESTEIATVQGATEYTDTYTATAPVLLGYSVAAANGSKTGATAETAKVKVGHIDLPFANSFTGDAIGAVWETEFLAGSTATNNWEVKESHYVGRNGGSTLVPPADADGAMAVYRSYDFNTTHEGRLVSSPISASSSTAPAVEFMWYHDNTQTKLDRMWLEVSCDNGEWTAVEGSTVNRLADESGWTKYVILIADALTPGCSTYRVGFHAKSEYGNNMFLDAVRIFNAAENDIELSLSAPSKMTAGSNATLTLTVANNGTAPIAASDYTLAIVSEYLGAFEQPAPVDLPGLSAVNFEIVLSPDAECVRAAGEYEFTAQAAYANDSNADNNAASATVATAYLAQPGVTAVAIEPREAGAYMLSWDAAGAVGYTPLNILEDFESLETGTKGNINGFTSIDLDGKEGSTWYLVSGKEFSVFSPNSTVEVKGKNAVGVTMAAYYTQNDWLISPELSVAEESTIDLSFFIGFKSSSYAYTWEVRYATGDYDPANPLEAFSNLVKKEESSSYATGAARADNTLYQRSYPGIPSEAKYIAIRLITYQSSVSATWIDNIKIVEKNPMPLLGYNVYQKGVGKLNPGMLSNADLEYLVEHVAFPADGSDPEFYITAVYPTGETAPSPMAAIEMPKAPLNLKAELQHDIFTGRNDLAISWDAHESHADDQVYVVKLNGARIAAVAAKSHIAEQLDSREHLIEVSAVKAGVIGTPATATFTISDDDYARASFALATNNSFIPEGVALTVTPAEGEAIELPFDAANAAEIGYLPKGTYALAAEAPFYHSWAESLVLDGDKHTEVSLSEIIMEPQAVDIEELPTTPYTTFRLSWSSAEMGRVIDFTVTLNGETFAEHLDAGQVDFEELPAGTYIAGVKANYYSGSSEEVTRSFISQNEITGLTEVSAAKAVVSTDKGAILIAAPCEALATVCNPAGQTIAALEITDGKATVAVAPGIYIVSILNQNIKVVVR